MLGAIVGDTIGSTREFDPIRTTDFELYPRGSSYTDDTVMTCAIADALLGPGDFGPAMRRLGRHYMGSGYGGRFYRWMDGTIEGPYNSFGNGSAMRVSPVAWAFETETAVLAAARATALPTHDHPEGVKGAEATALAIFLARKGVGKTEIKARIEEYFGYNLSRSLAAIRPGYGFDETCPKTVPEAITSFLEADSFEATIRNAISLGGDADTLAAIAGSIAEAFWGGVPDGLLGPAIAGLDERLYGIAMAFCARWRPEEAARLARFRPATDGS